jgi:hypothetical protein
MMEFLSGLDALNVIKFFAELIGVFAVVATMTPNENDNKVADWLLKVINIFGANLGKAKNAD